MEMEGEVVFFFLRVRRNRDRFSGMLTAFLQTAVLGYALRTARTQHSAESPKAGTNIISCSRIEQMAHPEIELQTFAMKEQRFNQAIYVEVINEDLHHNQCM